MIRALVFVAALSACTSSPSSGVTSAEVTCPTDSTLTYASFGESFIADNCLSCHASKQQPTLASQAAIKANKAAIISVAVTGTKMPQNGSLAVEERQLLGEWLACGAP
jgi:uncharacterized membrane protein